MSNRRARCPKCAVILGIPQGFRGSKVLCSCCQARFKIPALSDAEIIELIGHRNRDDSTISGVPVEFTPVEISNEIAEEIGQGPATKYAPIPAELEGFRLVRISRHGVLFEFPATLLEGNLIRSALPRRCLRCGTKGHLHPHLVIFSHHMNDCSTLETEFVDSTAMISSTEAMNLPIDEILEKLPNVKTVPEPANKPMPYWICDQCSPSNMILAQNEINRQTGQGLCLLQIRRFWRAEEFLLDLHCEDTAMHEEVRRALREHPETPWDTLPGVVQQRLKQWYKPHKGERFVTYMPDRSHSRSEDGISGIVVSNRRIIHNCDRRHRESEKGEPIELSFSMQGKQLRLTVQTPTWEVKSQVVDKVGLERLRRALAQENFQTTWH